MLFCMVTMTSQSTMNMASEPRDAMLYSPTPSTWWRLEMPRAMSNRLRRGDARDPAGTTPQEPRSHIVEPARLSEERQSGDESNLIEYEQLSSLRAQEVLVEGMSGIQGEQHQLQLTGTKAMSTDREARAQLHREASLLYPGSSHRRRGPRIGCGEDGRRKAGIRYPASSHCRRSPRVDAARTDDGRRNRTMQRTKRTFFLLKGGISG